MNTMKNVLQFDQRHLQRAQHPSTTMRMQSGQGMVYGESTMTPYYRDDFATLYHGDCREVLPQLEPVALQRYLDATGVRMELEGKK